MEGFRAASPVGIILVPVPEYQVLYIWRELLQAGKDDPPAPHPSLSLKTCRPDSQQTDRAPNRSEEGEAGPGQPEQCLESPLEESNPVQDELPGAGTHGVLVEVIVRRRIWNPFTNLQRRKTGVSVQQHKGHRSSSRLPAPRLLLVSL